MKKKVILPIILFAVVLIFFLNQYFQDNDMITREEAISIIKERHPNFDGEPVFENNCDESGSSCWKAEFINNETLITMGIDSSSGDVSEQSQECTEWWCDAPQCDYIRTETGDGYVITYYNTGCQSPTQICNATYNACEICQLKENCIRKTKTDYTNETAYRFDVIETNAYGVINTSLFECKIFDKESDLIFKNTTSVADCEMIITYYTKCAYDVCDFIPSYTLIPL